MILKKPRLKKALTIFRLCTLPVSCSVSHFFSTTASSLQKVLQRLPGLLHCSSPGASEGRMKKRREGRLRGRPGRREGRKQEGGRTVDRKEGGQETGSKEESRQEGGRRVDRKEGGE